MQKQRSRTRERDRERDNERERERNMSFYMTRPTTTRVVTAAGETEAGRKQETHLEWS